MRKSDAARARAQGTLSTHSGNTEQALVTEERHISVLYDTVLSYLQPALGKRFLDGTLGLGGHTEGLLAQGATVLGLDRDASALALARERLAPYAPRVHFAQTTYSHCTEELDKLGWDLIDGALLDIGVSSLQLDTPERGFSFMHDGPLDMRMDQSSGTSVGSLLAKARFEELKDIIDRYGEEPMAGRIARAIVDAREKAPINTTTELAAIVEQAYPAKWRATSRNHPATRTFQALRMVVNDELGELESFLTDILPRLAVGARLAVICFHSLEDRIVKNFFRTESKDCLCPPPIYPCICGHVASLRVLTKKPNIATQEEVRHNSRASSAKLRVAERLAIGERN